jgi:hypothetical protein
VERGKDQPLFPSSNAEIISSVREDAGLPPPRCPWSLSSRVPPCGHRKWRTEPISASTYLLHRGNGLFVGNAPSSHPITLGTLDRESQGVVEVESDQMPTNPTLLNSPHQSSPGSRINTCEKCQAKTEEAIPLISLSRALSVRQGKWPTRRLSRYPFAFATVLV